MSKTVGSTVLGGKLYPSESLRRAFSNIIPPPYASSSTAAHKACCEASFATQIPWCLSVFHRSGSNAWKIVRGFPCLPTQYTDLPPLKRKPPTIHMWLRRPLSAEQLEPWMSISGSRWNKICLRTCKIIRLPLWDLCRELGFGFVVLLRAILWMVLFVVHATEASDSENVPRNLAQMTWNMDHRLTYSV